VFGVTVHVFGAKGFREQGAWVGFQVLGLNVENLYAEVSKF